MIKNNIENKIPQIKISINFATKSQKQLKQNTIKTPK